MSTKLNSKLKDNWLVVLISVFIGVVGLYWQYQSRRHEMGGTLNATFHSRLLNNKDARTIIVCVEDSTIDLQDLYVTPTFDNPSEFSLKDFLLSYDVECTNIEIEPTSFVETHKYGKKEWIYKYKDDILAAHDDTKKPFSSYHLKDNVGRCYIKTKASYDGAVSAFEYNTDVWFIIEKNSKNLSFDNWKIDCKKRIFEIIDEQFYDVYYYAKNHQPEYQFDVALTASSETSKTGEVVNLSQQDTRDDKTNVQQPSKKDEIVEEVEKIEPPKHVTPIITEEAPVQSDTNSSSEKLTIESYVAQDKGDYIRYEIQLNEELEAGKEYVLIYDATDAQENTGNEGYLYLDTYARSESKKIIYNLSGTNITEFKELISNVNTEDYLEISNKDGKAELRNKTNSDLLCVFRYSGHSSSYREIKGNSSMTLDDIGNEPILVFDLGTTSGNDILPSYSEDGVKGYFLLFLFVILILLLCFGTIYLAISIISFFVIGFTDGWEKAKKDVIDDLSIKSLKETVNSNKESTGDKIWAIFITVSMYLSPIIWVIIYFFFIK